MMRKFKLILSIAASFLCALGFFACKDPDSSSDGGTNTSTVTFNLPINEYTVEVGMTNKLDVCYDGDEAIGYESSDVNVVTVSAEGVLTGVSEGNAFVTVTAGDFSAACKVTVTQTEYSIVLGGTDINLVVGAKKQFNAVLYKGGIAYNDEVEWSVSDAENCGFTYSGNSATFEATKEGVFTVTAASDKATAQCRVKVVAADAQRLNNPVPTVENCDTLKWTAVDGAEAYAVLVDNEWIEVENTSYVFETQMDGLKEGERLSVSIKALSKDNVQYLDSLLSTISLMHEYTVEKLSEVSCTKKGTVRYSCGVCERTYTVENYKEEHAYEDARCTVCQTLRSPELIYLFDDNWIPMPTNEDAAVTITEENENDTSLWKVKYRAYWENEVTGGSVNDARVLWSTVYDNRDQIPEADRLSCYYVAGTANQSEEFYVTSKYDDGIHGEGVVKYINTGAFSSNPFLKKVVLPESVTELRGNAMSSCSNLETVIMPGITYLPAIDHQAYTHNNFIDDYSLTTVVVGDGFFHYGRNFMALTTDLMPNGYTGQVNIYVCGDGTNEANIYANSGYILLNQLLSGNVYYYDETANLCETWNYTEDGEVEARFHDFNAKVCQRCGAIDADGVAYAYDAEQDCYYVADNSILNKSLVKILSEYNDGTNGTKPVSYVANGAFKGNVNIVAVVLPESVTSIGSDAFVNCSNLVTVVMPKVIKTGLHTFLNCDSLTTVVINGEAKFSRKTFTTGTEGYAAQLDMYIYGPANNITYWRYDGVDIPVEFSAAAAANNMLTGNVYFYSETLAGCGTWKYGYNGVTVEKSEALTHDYIDGDCQYCDMFDADGVAYAYDAELDCYYVAGNTGLDKSVVKILANYNDGVNGKKSVSYVATSAFSGNTKITAVILPESVTSIGSDAFVRCSNLVTVVMPGVVKTGLHTFLNCDSLTTVVVNGEAKFSRKTFTTGTAGYAAQLNMYIYGTANNITYWRYDGVDIPVEFSATDAANNMLTGNVYFYSAEEIAGTWYYDEDGNVAVWS